MGAEENFAGVIDLVAMRQIVWDEETLGETYNISAIEPEYLEKAQEFRELLIETVAETDDAIMEAYISETPVTEKMLLEAIRKATIDLKLVPVLCGSALRNKGIQPLIDAINRFLPSPVDIPPMQGIEPDSGTIVECAVKDSEPLAALIFKVAMIEGRKLSYVRIYSGKLTAKNDVYNPTRKINEKISRILLMHANKRERVASAGAGSIVGVVGLKTSTTGETLCNSEHPLLLENMEFYEPVISVAIEPKTHSDQEKLDEVIGKFIAEDPTLRCHKDEDTGQTILSGMGELHLEIIISRMLREFKTDVNVGKPQVVYRETVDQQGVSEAIFDREISGQHHFAQVSLQIKPSRRGSDITFESQDKELPDQFQAAIRKGVMESLASGSLMGYPVTDVAVTLTDARLKESSGSELAFTVAASMACQQALADGRPFLLEPIMKVEIFVPEAFMGEVIGDMGARNGKVESIEHRAGSQVIKATAPLALMFGYSTALRSATQGRGTFSMQFSHFDRS